MIEHSAKRPEDRRDFQIGIICALTLEAEKVEIVFDKRWKKKEDGSGYGRSVNDPNTYTTGVIAGHNVVLAYCPGIGSNSAGQVATWLMASFTGVKIIFVVGVCGAVPSYKFREKIQKVVLGDCLISTAVIQFDHGREGPCGFAKKDGVDGLGRASIQIRALMAKLQTSTNRQELTGELLKNLKGLQEADQEAFSILARMRITCTNLPIYILIMPQCSKNQSNQNVCSESHHAQVLCCAQVAFRRSQSPCNSSHKFQALDCTACKPQL